MSIEAKGFSELNKYNEEAMILPDFDRPPERVDSDDRMVLVALLVTTFIVALLLIIWRITP